MGPNTFWTKCAHLGPSSTRDTDVQNYTEASEAANLGIIDDIPDLDGPGEGSSGINQGISNLHLGDQPSSGSEIPPDLDDIPDMEEEGLEEEEDAGQAPVKIESDTLSIVTYIRLTNDSM